MIWRRGALFGAVSEEDKIYESETFGKKNLRKMQNN
jgi:hypothetical protein